MLYEGLGRLWAKGEGNQVWRRDGVRVELRVKPSPEPLEETGWPSWPERTALETGNPAEWIAVFPWLRVNERRVPLAALSLKDAMAETDTRFPCPDWYNDVERAEYHTPSARRVYPPERPIDVASHYSNKAERPGPPE